MTNASEATSLPMMKSSLIKRLGGKNQPPPPHTKKHTTHTHTLYTLKRNGIKSNFFFCEEHERIKRKNV